MGAVKGEARSKGGCEGHFPPAGEERQQKEQAFGNQPLNGESRSTAPRDSKAGALGEAIAVD